METYDLSLQVDTLKKLLIDLMDHCVSQFSYSGRIFIYSTPTLLKIHFYVRASLEICVLLFVKSAISYNGEGLELNIVCKDYQEYISLFVSCDFFPITTTSSQSLVSGTYVSHISAELPSLARTSPCSIKTNSIIELEIVLYIRRRQLMAFFNEWLHAYKDFVHN